MSLRLHINPTTGVLTYENPKTKRQVFVWREDLVDIGDACIKCQRGQVSPSYRLLNGDFTLSNLHQTLNELKTVRQSLNDRDARINGDDYLDLETAIEDLEGVIRRIQRIS